ncbi:MAG: heme exporter protein CcmD [Geminicoccaceae bacterium]|nr:heme exporter protein CcmD [Geminicoccaceae bacterium]
MAMGGYGAYVWAAFGFAAVCMVGLLWQSWSASRRRAAELEDLRRELRPRAARARRPEPLRPRRAENGS